MNVDENIVHVLNVEKDTPGILCGHTGQAEWGFEQPDLIKWHPCHWS